MNAIVRGMWCDGCGFFEEVDIDSETPCYACGCPGSSHVPAAVVEVAS